MSFDHQKYYIENAECAKPYLESFIPIKKSNVVISPDDYKFKINNYYAYEIPKKGDVINNIKRSPGRSMLVISQYIFYGNTFDIPKIPIIALSYNSIYIYS